MNADYSKGFSDGFAAAVRQTPLRNGDNAPTIAEGYQVSDNSKRIAVTLPAVLFETISERARNNSRSMSAEIRALLVAE